MPDVDAIHIGDQMRVSVALVDSLKADPASLSMPVVVKKIERDDDGRLVLWLENAPSDPA